MNRYIYKITNTETGQFYIGQRTYKKLKIENDSYMGSGVWITWSKEKYGGKLPVFFKKEILKICEDQEDLNDSEIYYISLYRNIS